MSSDHIRNQGFWLEGGQTTITCNDVIRNFKKRIFLEQRYRRMEDQKRGLVWLVTRILLKRESLNQELKNANVYFGRRVEKISVTQTSDVESSRTSLASTTHFEVLGLGFEASSPQKLPCPRLEDRLLFELLKVCGAPEKFFWGKTFFTGDRLKNFCEDLFFENTCICALDPWPWPRAFLSLASRVSVLERAVLGLGLGFFLCSWPWPWSRALCLRLHLCQTYHKRKSGSEAPCRWAIFLQFFFFFFGKKTILMQLHNILHVFKAICKKKNLILNIWKQIEKIKLFNPLFSCDLSPNHV